MLAGQVDPWTCHGHDVAGGAAHVQAAYVPPHSVSCTLLPPALPLQVQPLVPPSARAQLSQHPLCAPPICLPFVPLWVPLAPGLAEGCRRVPVCLLVADVTWPRLSSEQPVPEPRDREQGSPRLRRAGEPPHPLPDMHAVSPGACGCDCEGPTMSPQAAAGTMKNAIFAIWCTSGLRLGLRSALPAALSAAPRRHLTGLRVDRGQACDRGSLLTIAGRQQGQASRLSMSGHANPHGLARPAAAAFSGPACTHCYTGGADGY